MLFYWTFYLSKKLEKYIFLSSMQISILKWFLKFSFDHRNKFHLNIYSNRKQPFLIAIIFHNITVLTGQINTALVKIRHFKKNVFKTTKCPKLLNWVHTLNAPSHTSQVISPSTGWPQQQRHSLQNSQERRRCKAELNRQPSSCPSYSA